MYIYRYMLKLFGSWAAAFHFATSFIYITGHMSTSRGFRKEKTCEKKRKKEQTVKHKNKNNTLTGFCRLIKKCTSTVAME